MSPCSAGGPHEADRPPAPTALQVIVPNGPKLQGNILPIHICPAGLLPQRPQLWVLMAKACADLLSSQGDSSGSRAGTILRVQYEDLKRLLGVPWSLMPAASTLLVSPRFPFSGLLLAADPQASFPGRVSQQQPREQRREGQLWGEGTGCSEMLGPRIRGHSQTRSHPVPIPLLHSLLRAALCGTK